MQQQQASKTELACLYTKQKIQKRKVWNDGRLVVLQACARLHDANPVPGSCDPVLDQCVLSKDQRQALLTNKEMILEGEKFLIEVEGEWRPTFLRNNKKTKTTNRKMPLSLQKKFTIPPPFTPSSSKTDTAMREFHLGKRKRPLQPGELLRMHHNDSSQGDRTFRSQQQRSTTIQLGFEGHCRNIPNGSNASIDKYPTNVPGNHGFQRPSPHADLRSIGKLCVARPRDSLNAKRTSNSQISGAKVDSEDSAFLLENEAEKIALNRSSVGLHGSGMDQSFQDTLRRNEFDEDAFYGLEEENDGGHIMSSERIDCLSNINEEAVPDLPLQSTSTNTPKIPNQDDSVSDSALLAMFGAPPADQNVVEMREGNIEEAQSICVPTKFMLPSQSSSEDESL